MSITQFTLKIMLLFLPGIISFVIIDNLTIHNETKTYHRIVYSFILGFLSYLPWNIICEIIQLMYKIQMPTSFTNNLLNDIQVINLYEISIATLFSIIIGIIFTKCINNNIIYRFANATGISRKSSNVDIWLNLLSEGGFTWIYIRDLEHGRVYRGRLYKTSDFTERDGIILEDVSVYNEADTSNELYHVPRIYLPAKFENLEINII